MGPALAAGNVVVLKPSELTPLSTLRVAELMTEVGFPSGVGKVSFTGSTLVGQGVARGAAGTLKRVHLELGGKGANIIYGDADLEAAVHGSAFAIFHNQGQACIAGSRLIL